MVWAPISGYDDVVADPQAEALGLFPPIDSGSFGEYRTVASPIRIAGVETDPSAPSPRVGQHTNQVLADAGFDEAEIAALASDGIVAEDQSAEA